MTVKTQNYTAEQVAQMQEYWTKVEQTAQGRKAGVQHLAAQFGRTAQSVMAKLVSMKMYTNGESQKAEKAAQLRKADIVAAMARAWDVEASTLEDFTKLKMDSLRMLATKLELELELVGVE